MKMTLFQVMRFGIVGSVNTGIDLLIYLGLTRSTNFFASHYLLAAAIAFLIASLNSFIWNKHWTFRDGVEYSHKQLVRFYIVAAVALALNQIILWLLVSFSLHDALAKLLASVSAGGVNFLMQKFWTFPIVRDAVHTSS